MIGMSRAGLAERWQLFAGAFLSVTLGVALVQSSLLLLISAATYRPPAGLSAAERMEFTDSTAAVVSMLGIILGIATFLAGFIISSTFAFTVAQRRRDIALLRLVGGSRGQVRHMLLVTVGIPPGFDLQSEDLDAYVASRTISRYERTAKQLILYVTALPARAQLDLTYRLRATMPVRGSRFPTSSPSRSRVSR